MIYLREVIALALILGVFVGCYILVRPKCTWHYRNPYDRRCTICGRREVEHHVAGWPSKTWWEVFDPGDPKLH